jgi:hypothetical protein
MNSATLPSVQRAQARHLFLNYLAAQNTGKVAVFEIRDFMTDRPLNEPKFIGVAESKTAARNAFGFFYVGNNCDIVSL